MLLYPHGNIVKKLKHSQRIEKEGTDIDTHARRHTRRNTLSGVGAYSGSGGTWFLTAEKAEIETAT